jgi:hypothetical protein
MTQPRRQQPQSGARVIVLSEWRGRLAPPLKDTEASWKAGYRRLPAKFDLLRRFFLSSPMILILIAISAGLLLTAAVMWISAIIFVFFVFVLTGLVRKFVWPRLKAWVRGEPAVATPGAHS